MSKSKTKQKKSSAAKNIAIFFIVFVILEGLIIFGLSKIFKNENSVVSAGGYSFFIMDSSNMKSDIPKHALVIATNGTPSTDKCGYAVLCKNVENEGTTVAWLYDISSKGDTVDGVVYTVYQESAPDKMYDLTSSDIVGITASYYMTAGKIVAFVTTPFGMAICIAAPLVLLVLIELIIAVSRRSNDDDYDDDEYDGDAGDNVTLDDFLYGGEDDEVYSSEKPKGTYEEEFENKYASMMNRNEQPYEPEETYEEPAFEQPVYEEPVYEEPVQQPIYEEPACEPEPAPVVEEPKPEIDKSYYEKASKMIDEAVSAKSEEPTVNETTVAAAVSEEPAVKAKPASQRRPAQQGQRRRPAQHGARPSSAQHRTRPVGTPRSASQRQNANEALDKLMKMMEEEQKKLRESTGSNGDKQ